MPSSHHCLVGVRSVSWIDDKSRVVHKCIHTADETGQNFKLLSLQYTEDYWKLSATDANSVHTDDERRQSCLVGVGGVNEALQSPAFSYQTTLLCKESMAQKRQNYKNTNTEAMETGKSRWCDTCCTSTSLIAKTVNIHSNLPFSWTGSASGIIRMQYWLIDVYPTSYLCWQLTVALTGCNAMQRRVKNRPTDGSLFNDTVVSSWLQTDYHDLLLQRLERQFGLCSTALLWVRSYFVRQDISRYVWRCDVVHCLRHVLCSARFSPWSAVFHIVHGGSCGLGCQVRRVSSRLCWWQPAVPPLLS